MSSCFASLPSESECPCSQIDIEKSSTSSIIVGEKGSLLTFPHFQPSSTQATGGGDLLSAASTSGGKNQPQTLDELLERQWEQGSQFLMEQASHFDSKIEKSILNEICCNAFLSRSCVTTQLPAPAQGGERRPRVLGRPDGAAPRPPLGRQGQTARPLLNLGRRPKCGWRRRRRFRGRLHQLDAGPPAVERALALPGAGRGRRCSEHV